MDMAIRKCFLAQKWLHSMYDTWGGGLKYAVTGLSNCQSISTAPPAGLTMQASLPIKCRHRWGIFINCGHVMDKIFVEWTCTVHCQYHIWNHTCYYWKYTNKCQIGLNAISFIYFRGQSQGLAPQKLCSGPVLHDPGTGIFMSSGWMTCIACASCKLIWVENLTEYKWFKWSFGWCPGQGKQFKKINQPQHYKPQLTFN